MEQQTFNYAPSPPRTIAIAAPVGGIAHLRAMTRMNWKRTVLPSVAITLNADR
jgi:hypothetical protein